MRSDFVLSRYTHCVAISNQRLLAFDTAGVTFRYKDYRRGSADRQHVMSLGRSNRAAASSPSRARRRQLRSDAVNRAELQRAKRGRHRPISQQACRPDLPRRQSNRSSHQPTTQFPIDRRLPIAGSFFQDFRTPRGVRNSSGKLTVGSRAGNTGSGHGHPRALGCSRPNRRASQATPVADIQPHRGLWVAIQRSHWEVHVSPLHHRPIDDHRGFPGATTHYGANNPVWR